MITVSSLLKFKNKYPFGTKSSIVPTLNKFIGETGQYKDATFSQILGEGSLSVIFDIGNNRVLKVSKENPFKYRKHNPEVDIPVFNVNQYGDCFFIEEAKAQACDKPNLYNNFIKKMKQHNLEPSKDFNQTSYKRQIGIYEDKILLLDSRCAMPEPNKFSILINRFVNKYKKTSEEACFDVFKNGYHIDETPRTNYTIKEGLSLIVKTIKENINLPTTN